MQLLNLAVICICWLTGYVIGVDLGADRELVPANRSTGIILNSLYA